MVHDGEARQGTGSPVVECSLAIACPLDRSLKINCRFLPFRCERTVVGRDPIADTSWAGEGPPMCGALRNNRIALASWSGSGAPPVFEPITSFFIDLIAASALPFD